MGKVHKKRRYAFLVCLAALLCGCGNQDAEQLTRVGRRAVARLESATGGANRKLAGSLEALRINGNGATLDRRVSSRLRWDKTLADAVIEVQATSDGVVELTGRVADLAQRRRAVELAETTTGVERVIDALAVAQP